MDFVARAHGGELYRQFRELLPEALSLRRPDGSALINCKERRICNEPLLCLKAYLSCKEKWMEKELRSLAAGDSLRQGGEGPLGRGGRSGGVRGTAQELRYRVPVLTETPIGERRLALCLLDGVGRLGVDSVCGVRQRR